MRARGMMIAGADEDGEVSGGKDQRFLGSD